jgi:hypothetical protein
MDKIAFTNCSVTIDKKEQNYLDYSIKLKLVAKIELNGKEKYCKATMEDNSVIEVRYFGEAPKL